ncbi:MAG TPA: hypothetical protein VF320_09755 [Acidimicrobiales bacterium]
MRRTTALRDEELCRRPTPAKALDDAVVHSLLSAYEDTDLFSMAIAEARERADVDESPHDGERAALQAELDKVERGIGRYLRAFEAGTMPVRGSAANGSRIWEPKPRPCGLACSNSTRG